AGTEVGVLGEGGVLVEGDRAEVIDLGVGAEAGAVVEAEPPGGADDGGGDGVFGRAGICL
ncbi:MAG: hypothetical protein AAFY59_18220, partial [Pseudomonadota bacterium]